MPLSSGVEHFHGKEGVPGSIREGLNIARSWWKGLAIIL